MAARRQHIGIRLDAMALDIPDFPDHPNRVPFSGVLTLVDRPSDRAPNGAEGHRVLLPRRVAERALPSLLGMAVDFAPGLRGHDVRRKIGIITRAEVVGDRLEVSGHLFGKDFPDVIRDLRAGRDRLGMSYEVTDVRVRDRKADIWVLDRVVFTGAAILERDAAAYQTTSLAATTAGKRGDAMDERTLQALEALVQTNQAFTAECNRLCALLNQLNPARGSVSRLEATGENTEIETRVASLERTAEELRRQNEALRAQAERFTAQATRKTIPPQVLTLLAKSGVATDLVSATGKIEVPVLDKALEGLPIEQRIAVKSQLARAGAIE